MSSLVINGFPLIKVEDEIIDVDLDVPPQTVENWDEKIRKILLRAVDGKILLEDLLRIYSRSLHEQIKVSQNRSLLKDKILTHLSYFNAHFTEAQDYINTASYYELMEDVLAYYCTLELDLVRQHARNKGKFTQAYLMSVSHKVCLALTMYLANDERHIMHVLMRMKYSSNSIACKLVMGHVYMHNLYKGPVNKSDEAFCRAYIVLCKYKEVEGPEQHSLMDHQFFHHYRRTKAELEKNEMFTSIFMIKPDSIVDAVSMIMDLETNVVSSYYKYMQRFKLKRERAILRNETASICEKVDPNEEELVHEAFGAKVAFNLTLQQSTDLEIPKDIVVLDDDEEENTDDADEVISIPSDNEDNADSDIEITYSVLPLKKVKNIEPSSKKIEIIDLCDAQQNVLVVDSEKHVPISAQSSNVPHIDNTTKRSEDKSPVADLKNSNNDIIIEDLTLEASKKSNIVNSEISAIMEKTLVITNVTHSTIQDSTLDLNAGNEVIMEESALITKQLQENTNTEPAKSVQESAMVVENTSTIKTYTIDDNDKFVTNLVEHAAIDIAKTTVIMKDTPIIENAGHFSTLKKSIEVPNTENTNMMEVETNPAINNVEQSTDLKKIVITESISKMKETAEVNNEQHLTTLKDTIVSTNTEHKIIVEETEIIKNAELIISENTVEIDMEVTGVNNAKQLISNNITTVDNSSMLKDTLLMNNIEHSTTSDETSNMEHSTTTSEEAAITNNIEHSTTSDETSNMEHSTTTSDETSNMEHSTTTSEEAAITNNMEDSTTSEEAAIVNNMEDSTTSEEAAIMNDMDDSTTSEETAIVNSMENLTTSEETAIMNDMDHLTTLEETAIVHNMEHSTTLEESALITIDNASILKENIEAIESSSMGVNKETTISNIDVKLAKGDIQSTESILEEFAEILASTSTTTKSSHDNPMNTVRINVAEPVTMVNTGSNKLCISAYDNAAYSEEVTEQDTEEEDFFDTTERDSPLSPPDDVLLDTPLDTSPTRIVTLEMSEGYDASYKNVDHHPVVSNQNNEMHVNTVHDNLLMMSTDNTSTSNTFGQSPDISKSLKPHSIVYEYGQCTPTSDQSEENYPRATLHSPTIAGQMNILIENNNISLTDSTQKDVGKIEKPTISNIQDCCTKNPNNAELEDILLTPDENEGELDESPQTLEKDQHDDWNSNRNDFENMSSHNDTSDESESIDIANEINIINESFQIGSSIVEEEFVEEQAEENQQIVATETLSTGYKNLLNDIFSDLTEKDTIEESYIESGEPPVLSEENTDGEYNNMESVNMTEDNTVIFTSSTENLENNHLELVGNNLEAYNANILIYHNDSNKNSTIITADEEKTFDNTNTITHPKIVSAYTIKNGRNRMITNDNNYIQPCIVENNFQVKVPPNVLYSSGETIEQNASVDEHITRNESVEEFEETLSGPLKKVNGINNHYDNYNLFDTEKSIIKAAWEDEPKVKGIMRVGGIKNVTKSIVMGSTWGSVNPTSDLTTQCTVISSSAADDAMGGIKRKNIGGLAEESTSHKGSGHITWGPTSYQKEKKSKKQKRTELNLDVRQPYEQLKRKNEEEDNYPHKVHVMKLGSSYVRCHGVTPSDLIELRINLTRVSDLPPKQYVKTVSGPHITNRTCIRERLNIEKEPAIASPSRVPFHPEKYLEENPVSGQQSYAEPGISGVARTRNNGPPKAKRKRGQPKNNQGGPSGSNRQKLPLYSNTRQT